MITNAIKWLRFGVLLMCLALLAGCSLSTGAQSGTQSSAQSNAHEHSAQNVQNGHALTGFEEVAQYIRKHGELPDNYITKKEARKLGWDAQKGNLNEVAPGKSIGGDVFGNREKKLPGKKGRIWYEADINYTSGFRGDDRILFSSDGLIFKSEDHYKTFQEMK